MFSVSSRILLSRELEPLLYRFCINVTINALHLYFWTHLSVILANSSPIQQKLFAIITDTLLQLYRNSTPNIQFSFLGFITSISFICHFDVVFQKDAVFTGLIKNESICTIGYIFPIEVLLCKIGHTFLYIWC